MSCPSILDKGDYATFVKNMHDSNNWVCTMNPKNSKFIANIYLTRSDQEVGDQFTRQIIGHHKDIDLQYVRFMSPHINITQCKNAPSEKTETSGMLLSNSTAAHQYFKRIAEKFQKQFKAKMFLHKYTEYGMDEMEFTEAISNFEDLCSEYQQYEQVEREGEGEGEGEEDED